MAGSTGKSRDLASLREKYERGLTCILRKWLFFATKNKFLTKMAEDRINKAFLRLMHKKVKNEEFGSCGVSAR